MCRPNSALGGADVSRFELPFPAGDHHGCQAIAGHVHGCARHVHDCVDADPVEAVRTKQSRGRFDDPLAVFRRFLPTDRGLRMSALVVHEVAGLTYYWLKGWYKSR